MPGFSEQLNRNWQPECYGNRNVTLYFAGHLALTHPEGSIIPEGSMSESGMLTGVGPGLAYFRELCQGDVVRGIHLLRTR